MVWNAPAQTAAPTARHGRRGKQYIMRSPPLYGSRAVDWVQCIASHIFLPLPFCKGKGGSTSKNQAIVFHGGVYRAVFSKGLCTLVFSLIGRKNKKQVLQIQISHKKKLSVFTDSLFIFLKFNTLEQKMSSLPFSIYFKICAFFTYPVIANRPYQTPKKRRQVPSGWWFLFFSVMFGCMFSPYFL